MIVSNDAFRLLSRMVGVLLALMGVPLVVVFLVYVGTGESVLAGQPVGADGLGLLVLASVGAFALPLGLPLAVGGDGTSVRLRIAAYALGFMALLRLAGFFSPEIRAVAGTTPLVEFFVLGGVATLALWIRPRDEAPIEIHTSAAIEAPASAVWHALAERFGEVHTFARGVRSAVLSGPVEVGSVRTCQTEPFGPFSSSRITEELVEFSPEAMRFAYVAGGELPSFIPASTNRWSVVPDGPERCRAVSHVSIELAWWALPFASLLAWSIRSELGRFGEDLRQHVETP